MHSFAHEQKAAPLVRFAPAATAPPFENTAPFASISDIEAEISRGVDMGACLLQGLSSKRAAEKEEEPTPKKTKNLSGETPERYAGIYNALASFNITAKHSGGAYDRSGVMQFYTAIVNGNVSFSTCVDRLREVLSSLGGCHKHRGTLFKEPSKSRVDFVDRALTETIMHNFSDATRVLRSTSLVAVLVVFVQDAWRVVFVERLSGEMVVYGTIDQETCASFVDRVALFVVNAGWPDFVLKCVYGVAPFGNGGDYRKDLYALLAYRLAIDSFNANCADAACATQRYRECLRLFSEILAWAAPEPRARYEQCILSRVTYLLVTGRLRLSQEVIMSPFRPFVTGV